MKKQNGQSRRAVAPPVTGARYHAGLPRRRLLLLCCVCATCVFLFLPRHALAQLVDDNSARAFIEQGERQRVRDEYTAAVESYRRALALAERAGDTAAQSRAVLGLGECYTQQVKFSRALEALQQSLALSEAGGDTAGMARANNALGYVYYRLYYYDSAERHLAQSLAQFESVGDRGGMASVLNNMGRNHISQGGSPEYKARALAYYRRSVALGEASGNQEAVAGALNNLGNLYNVFQTFHQAISYYERAQAIYEALGRRRRVGVVLGNLSRAYWHVYDGMTQEGFKPVEAGRRHLDYAERSVSVLSVVEADDDLWEAFVNLGTAHWTVADIAGVTPGALSAFNEAIRIIERMRREADGDELTLQRYFRGQTSPYNQAADLLMQNGRYAESLAYVERAKARVLLDMLQRARVVDAASASGKALAQRLDDELTALNGELVRERQKQQPDEALLAGLRERLQQVRQALLDGQARAANAQPQNRRLRREVKPISLAEMSALLPDEHSALLEYSVSDSWIYLFVLTRGKPEHALPGREQAGTESQVVLKGYITKIKSKGDFNARVVDLRRRLATRDNDYRKLAREFYDLLLRPAREQLRGKTSLVIVPDRELWDLPFQTLLDEEGRHLIENAAVSYAPSLTALREMKKARREPASNTPAGALLALGNPALSSDTIARTRTRYRDARLEPLPEAEKEVAAIGRLYDGKRSRVYTGAGAREKLLKEEAGRYEILHLAMHAIVNDENPMFSALVLSQAGKQPDEDGLLEAREIMQMNLLARLVVLSACETARGQASHGEGMMGLSWAFQVAGVPAVVVSQWPVESASTTALMIEFHRQLRAQGRARVSTAEALRRASLRQLRRDRSLHPFYWAAFVVVGDGE